MPTDARRDGAEPSSQATESQLWDAYWADRSDANRNAIVEHYLPWVRRTARRFIRNQPIIDKANALAEVVLAFCADMVPQFDGRSAFRTNATRAIYNRVYDLARCDDYRRTISLDSEKDSNGRKLIDSVASPQSPVCRLCDAMVGLPPRDAALLWLYYCREVRLSEIAAILGVNPETAKKLIQKSRKAARKSYPR